MAPERYALDCGRGDIAHHQCLPRGSNVVPFLLRPIFFSGIIIYSRKGTTFEPWGASAWSVREVSDLKYPLFQGNPELPKVLN